MVKAVLFDVDFTIARPGPELGPEGYQRLGERFGLELDPSRYATAREPTVWMTNGSSTAAVKTIAEVRARYLEGWDFGTAAHPGVRMHIPNSRTEKIVQPVSVPTNPVLRYMLKSNAVNGNETGNRCCHHSCSACR